MIKTFMLLLAFTITGPVGETRDERVHVLSRHFDTKPECINFINSWSGLIKDRGLSTVEGMLAEGGKVSFEFPENPLIVPQMCLRFNDIENVGISGKHFTSFVMIGQHSGNGKNGYWKDRCIDLDFQLLLPYQQIYF